MSVEQLQVEAIKEIREASTHDACEKVRIKYLGRKDGKLIEILKSLKDMSVEERRTMGTAANELRQLLEHELEEKIEKIKEGENEKKNRFDITKPGKRVASGHLHPLTKVDKEVRTIFSSLNFTVVEGPELEKEVYNFDKLNIPAEHSARDMWDTLWVKKDGNNGLLMRTHTSPVQARYMESHNPPFQIIVPGRVFRYEATDASHEINFYQVEGLMVGPDITLANLKFIIETFFKKFFKQKIEFRYRPSYFPFVEPGLEVDIKLKDGKWMEVMGAGMVHRNVFDWVKYNHTQVQGFAFGMGLDRLAMIKYGVPDCRLFYSGDIRFTKNFK
ncbi:MAG: phenylalanine--tRNA ligase subunit alpha [Candidatus Paceibacterota bacterium]|jgi:phenylalanyl-tRNA synthetase alpha chain